MQQFARGVGFLSLAAGVLLLGFPEAARRMMKARAEFSELSPAALRLLGGWELMMGALLVAATSPAEEVRAREAIPPELRRAA